MYKTISVLVALAMVAAVAPGMQADEASYADRNVAWFVENHYPAEPNMDAVGVLQTSEGEVEMTVGEFFELFGERTERVDLEAAVAGAGPGAGQYAGDVWIAGTVAACPADNVIAPGHGQFVPVDTQLWLYPDPVQDISVSGSLSVIGWTTKNTGFHSNVHTLGTSDNFCFVDPFFGITTYAPFINGVVDGS